MDSKIPVVINKRWYLSKTLWINIISLIGIVIQTKSGNSTLSPELEVSLLSAINIVLRTVTKSNVIW